MAQEGETADRDFVELVAYTYLAEAELVRELLESEGIEVFLQNAQFASTLPHMTNAVGGVRVTVAPADLARAREVLDAEGGVPESASDAQALEGDDNVEHPRDLVARRAWRAAVLGIAFFPVGLHLYSSWLAVRFHTTTGPTSAGSARRANLALAIDAIVIGIAAALLLR